MEQFSSVIILWIPKIQELLSRFPSSEIIGYVLMTVDAILSAFFTEILFKDRNKNKNKKNTRVITGEAAEKKKKSFLKDMFFFWAVSLIFLLLNVGITLGLFAFWIHFVPQGESLVVLLKKIIETYSEAFMIPLITTVIAGVALKGMTWEKKWAKSLLCLVLALSALSSSFTFLWNSVEIIQRPHYAPPVESISALVNSRLKVYPFIMSAELLEAIGDGEELLVSPDTLLNNSEAGELYEEIYEEPNDFRGYIEAIVEGTYAPGKGEIDYLLSAYDLFKIGRHGNDYFCIGLMWNYLYYDSYYINEEFEISDEECLENALAAYQECEKKYASASLYNNMAIIYDILDDKEQVRACMRSAMELDAEDDVYRNNYLMYIYEWIGNEEPLMLMEDARAILQNKNHLAMYILYGAYAVAENRDVMDAYELLCKADEYYQGKSTMVQILRCICADLLSINDTVPLYDIYQTEKGKGLSKVEELYLIRYLFASGRYDELWGYINEVGTEEEMEFSVDKAAMKASWYFSGQNGTNEDIEGMENLLYKIDKELETDAYNTDEKNLLLMSKSLLKNRLIEDVDIDVGEYETDETSDIEYVFCATNAFNNAEYDRAIRYCENFFDVVDTLDKSEAGDGISLQNLAPQEQVTLRYYMQLISAHAHYECAKQYRKGSDEWQNHIDMAEKECDVFERSAKSFFYIEEHFKELRGFIYKEKGEWPMEEDEKLRIEET